MYRNLLRMLLTNVLPIILGTAVYAFGLHYFVIPNEFMEGGVTGIGLLLNYALSIPLSLTTLLLNIPLFFVGWRYLGRKTMGFTIMGTVFLSYFLWIMEILIDKKWIEPFHSKDDLLLAALYAGVTLGLGLGVVFRFGGTTGGSDIIARILHKKIGWSMGQVFLLWDVIVIGASLFYISQEKVLYTLVAVFVAAKVIDFIQEGAYAAKAFTVVTDHATDIADAITKEMDRGVTLFPAKGAYSKMDKEVVYCVVYRSETTRLKDIVNSIDPRAFIIISDVHDVLGEGFRTE